MEKSTPTRRQSISKSWKQRKRICSRDSRRHSSTYRHGSKRSSHPSTYQPQPRPKPQSQNPPQPRQNQQNQRRKTLLQRRNLREKKRETRLKKRSRPSEKKSSKPWNDSNK